jgi:hypothetical protein
MPATTRPLAQRAASALALSALLLVQGCAMRAPRAAADAHPDAAMSDAHARQVVAMWQQQLTDYLQRAGAGDPAALAQLPARRATGTLRPARITFGALDVETGAAEREGFDVQGLLLDAAAGVGAQPYVFVVGILQREGYRPMALVDVRLVALTPRGGQLLWTVGDGDAQALARYRAAVDADTPLRFPADKDRFELVACGTRWCADEHASGARWSLDIGMPALARAAP